MSHSDSAAHDHGPTSFWTKYIFSQDHKVIGIQFMFVSFLFMILGGFMAMMIRWQLAYPDAAFPLAWMVAASLFPGGVLQLQDVLQNGYWHARGPEFLSQELVRMMEWFRLPGDAVFIAFGVLPAVVAAVWGYWLIRRAQSQA